MILAEVVMIRRLKEEVGAHAIVDDRGRGVLIIMHGRGI